MKLRVRDGSSPELSYKRHIEWGEKYSGQSGLILAHGRCILAVLVSKIISRNSIRWDEIKDDLSWFTIQLNVVKGSRVILGLNRQSSLEGVFTR